MCIQLSGDVGITIGDDEGDHHQEQQQQQSDRIVVKVKTLSEKPIRVEILPSATVGELKEQVKKQANAEGKFLRLIHQVRYAISSFLWWYEVIELERWRLTA